MPSGDFSPLVIGSPRSGFVLLNSIVMHLLPLAGGGLSPRQRMLNGVIDLFGDHVANRVVEVFRAQGLEERLIYNQNFRQLTGGPKWLADGDDQSACFRKYIGVRGLGDFTLVTRHPRAVLHHDEIIHSHSHPARWVRHPDYRSATRFASVRNPIGIVNSSLFSINALTSEYIQFHLPPEQDNDELRQELALFKFTNLDFYRGLLSFYKAYFDEFLPLRDAFTPMRWEDLIERPVPTIQQVAAGAGLELEPEHAAQIWARIDHVNLTGAHKHNLRKGKGKVGDWRRWMTNRHLQLMDDSGFGPIIEALGYEPLAPLDEAVYTPFQRRVDELLAQGRVYEDYADQDLFQFAFNKSNLDSSRFSFKRYGWKSATCVERSSFQDEPLQEQVWAEADTAAERLNRLFQVVLEADWSGREAARGSVDRVLAEVTAEMAGFMPRAAEAAPGVLEQLLGEAFDPVSGRTRTIRSAPPRLVRSYPHHNLVAYEGAFYGVPLAAGELNLVEADLTRIPGAFRAENFGEAQQMVRHQEGVLQAHGGRWPEIVMGDDPQPHPVATQPTHNIVLYRGWYYRIPHALGPMDLTRVEVAELPGVTRARSMGQLTLNRE